MKQIEPAKNVDWKQAKNLLIFSAIVVLLCLIFLQTFPFLQFPILFSLFLTYLLGPVVEKLVKFNFPRTIVISVLLGTFILTVVLVSIKLLPIVFDQMKEIIEKAPAAFQTLSDTWLPKFKEDMTNNSWIGKQFVDYGLSKVDVIGYVNNQLHQTMSQILANVPKILGSLVNVIIVPVLTFFFLKELPTLTEYIEQMTPRDMRRSLYKLAKTTDLTMKSVIKGQVTVAFILAGLYTTGFTIVGLGSSVAIGLIAGMCRIIPYLDVVVGGILSGVVLATTSADWPQIAAVLGVFVIVQTLDGMIITPRVIGERVGLHPIVVILSVISFGAVLGFWGGLFAIPIVALTKNLWNLLLPYYFASAIYNSSTQKEKEIKVE